MNTSELHSPPAHRRIGFSVQEALAEIKKHYFTDWTIKLRGLDWKKSGTKRWQVTWGFATASCMGVDPDQAQDFLMKMIVCHGGFVSKTDIEQIRFWADHGYLHYSMAPYILDFRASFSLELVTSAEFDGGECDREFLAAYDITRASE